MPYIYKLIDPITEEVRYVGKTGKLLHKRLATHISRSKEARNHKDCWILSLKSKGLKPRIELIEEALDVDWEERETYWISEYRKTGRLTNVADGGGVNRPKSGQDNHKALFSKEDVREAVTLFVIGFSREIIRSFPKFNQLSDKTLRSWCQKETRTSDTEGIPTRRQFKRNP